MTLNAQFIFNAAMGGLGRENVFLDIGHGIGNVVIQGAFTRGCRSRGIEYVEERNTLASIYKWGFNDISEFHVTEGIVRSLMYFFVVYNITGFASLSRLYLFPPKEKFQTWRY